ncbi:hypothetical protein N9O17_00850 [Candidatus Pelagibacter sp.]|nr:hypothetical protein [Candidatus Pelagibacter sp.]
MKGNMFKYILIAISILTLIGGFYSLDEAKTSIHEISGILMWVISAICFTGYGIIAQFEDIRRKTKKPSKDKVTSKLQVKSITPNILSKATFWKAHTIKNPEDYGGWVKYIYWWGLVPYIGIIIGIVGLTRNNIIKNAQGKGLIFISLLVFLWIHVVKG